MRRIVLLLLVVLLSAPLFAAGVSETAPEQQEIMASLAVLKGPTGFGYVHLLGEQVALGAGVAVQAEVLPSPNEALARLISGEADLAAIPANAAAVLFNKGVDIRLAAVTGEGMLYLLSRDMDAEYSREAAEGLLADGKQLYVPAPGSTPDLVNRYLLDAWGFDADSQNALVNMSIASPAQLAQLLIAGKVEHALLPEPFATMAEMKSPEVFRTDDIQRIWQEETGIASYPMTALVVQGSFADEHPAALQTILAAVKASIGRVTGDPAEAAVLIEEFGILAAALAEPSIPRCALGFEYAADARSAFERYLEIMAGLDPAVIGGKVPDASFYAGQ